MFWYTDGKSFSFYSETLYLVDQALYLSIEFLTLSFDMVYFFSNLYIVSIVCSGKNTSSSRNLNNFLSMALQSASSLCSNFELASYVLDSECFDVHAVGQMLGCRCVRTKFIAMVPLVFTFASWIFSLTISFH